MRRPPASQRRGSNSMMPRCPAGSSRRAVCSGRLVPTSGVFRPVRPDERCVPTGSSRRAVRSDRFVPTGGAFLPVRPDGRRESLCRSCGRGRRLAGRWIVTGAARTHRRFVAAPTGRIGSVAAPTGRIGAGRAGDSPPALSHGRRPWSSRRALRPAVAAMRRCAARPPPEVPAPRLRVLYVAGYRSDRRGTSARLRPSEVPHPGRACAAPGPAGQLRSIGLPHVVRSAAGPAAPAPLLAQQGNCGASACPTSSGVPQGRPRLRRSWRSGAIGLPHVVRSAAGLARACPAPGRAGHLRSISWLKPSDVTQPRRASATSGPVGSAERWSRVNRSHATRVLTISRGGPPVAGCRTVTAAMGSCPWAVTKVPTDGHGFCPVVATNLPNPLVGC